jgi:hypothetical protein
VISLVGHLVVLFVSTFGMYLLPAPEPIMLGTGEGGGSGEFVSVGLSAQVGGGEGMYKPPITPRADSLPQVREEEEETPPRAEEPQPEENVFEATEVVQKKEPPRAPPPKKEPEKPTDGLIPREPDLGKGEASGGGAGSGGGFGSGRGVKIGSGTGEGGIDSWYIRQVEQRVGQNWLQTSLGQIDRRVQAIATFLVRRNGVIDSVEFEKRSGIRSVDLAVERAILASTPLPPLPYELRGRTIKFKAVFEYPPR